MNHWADQYIGQPWAAGAQGPDAWDCWAFFRHVQATHYGVQVPLIIAPDYDDPIMLSELFVRHVERAYWLSINEPEDGCLVEIRKPSLHVGLWLPVDGGGVLHCVRGAGVVYTKDRCWALSGFGRKKYFRRRAG